MIEDAKNIAENLRSGTYKAVHVPKGIKGMIHDFKIESKKVKH